jgi:hypothetical protein
MQAAMLQALAPFPAARAAVVDALRSLDSEGARTVATPTNGKLIELEAVHD